VKSDRLSVHSPSPGDCLDDLLASRFLPRRAVPRIWSAGQLPVRLKRCAGNLLPGAEWRAYGDHEQMFFAIARNHSEDPVDASATAIDAYFLDANAVVYAAGIWQHTRQNGWWLDALMDLTYDCEHGWWPEAVMRRTSTKEGHAALTAGRGEFRMLSGPRRCTNAALQPGVRPAPAQR